MYLKSSKIIKQNTSESQAAVRCESLSATYYPNSLSKYYYPDVKVGRGSVSDRPWRQIPPQVELESRKEFWMPSAMY